MNFKAHYNRFYVWGFLSATALLLCVILLLATSVGGCTQLTQFQITNASRNDIAVTSSQTGKTVHISRKKSGFVLHTMGDITITANNGKTWIYRNLSPRDFKGTPFAVKKDYVLFGFQDGYMFRGSLTANLLLDKNLWLYAVPAHAEDIDVVEPEQPIGFPIKPGMAKTTD